MNIRKFHSADYPHIVAIHNSLNIVWPEWSRDPDVWMETDRNRDPKCNFQRWVAEVDGKVVGVASCGNRLDDYHPQKFYINVEVLAEYRRNGIGAALYERLMEVLEPHHPLVLRTDVIANQIQSYPFVQKRGFQEVWRETPVHLNVTGYDLSPYAAIEEAQRAAGIEIKTLRELKSDPDCDRKVYDLYMKLEKDVPSEYSEFTPSPYEDWLAWCLNDPTTNPDAFFIAVQGERYVALHELGAEPSSPVLMGGLLGTLPEFRKQRIGLVLMMRAIAFAQQHEMTVFKTCTASVNTRMQELFKKLGFVHDPEWLQCEKGDREQLK